MPRDESSTTARVAISLVDICRYLDVGPEGLIIVDAFSGVGFRTDQGIFGIAIRDSGIEVTLDGTFVWSSAAVASVGQEAPDHPRCRRCGAWPLADGTCDHPEPEQ